MHVGTKLLLVEDCAQCLPIATANYAPGSLADAAIFSNNLMKPLPAGSGGMAVTADRGLAGAIAARADHLRMPATLADLELRLARWAQRHLLRPSTYWPLFDAYRRIDRSYRPRPLAEELRDEIEIRACRPSAYQTEVGVASLRDVGLYAEFRRQCYREYASALTGLDDVRPLRADNAQPLYYFPVLARDKRELLRRARALRIELVAWPVAAPIYPLGDIEDLRQYGYVPGACPSAEDVARCLVGLPMRPGIRHADRRRAIELLRADTG